MIKVGVYKITNSLDGKLYIGSSSNIYKRWDRHRNSLRKGTHPNLHLQQACNRDGLDAFVFEIIEETIKDKKVILEREQFYIDLYKSFENDKGYNLTTSSSSPAGFRHTEAAKEAIRQARLGKRLSKASRKKVTDFLTGHEVSQETRDKISEANKGKTAWNKGLKTGPLPESQKKAIGKGNKGKRTGIFVSEETRRKLSESHKGQIPWQHKNNP
jgi:group I intron endonuclease